MDLRAPSLPLLLLLLAIAALPSTVFSSEAELSLKALFGSDVVLPCKAPEGTDLEDVTLEWTRSDLGQNYIFLFRDGQPLLVDQHNRFKDRVELIDPTLRSGDLSIRLHRAGQWDSGRYECRVFKPSHIAKRSVFGTRPIRTINLTVTDLSLEVPVKSDVDLPCWVPEGTDLEDVAVEWTRSDLHQSYVFLFRDGQTLLDDQHHHFEGRVDLVDPTLRSGDLSIRLHDVRRTDSGRYECHIVGVHQSHVSKRSVSGTRPNRTIDLTVTGPKTIRAFTGRDVVLPLPPLDFPVTSLMWKRQDDPDRFVFLMGMGHPHHQHPLYSGRTELSNPEKTGNQTRDLSMILRSVQPSDSGTYHCHIVQSRRRKRDLHQSEPYSVVILKVESSGALRVEAGAGFAAVVLVSLFLKILE